MVPMAAPRTLPDRTCIRCGTQFRQKSRTTGKYCSRTCWYQDYDDSNRKNCEVCGSEFSGHSSQRTCSRTCGNILKTTAFRHVRCQLEGCMNLLSPHGHQRVKFCSRSHAMTGRSGRGATLGSGTRRPHSSGYMLIKTSSGWKMEHRVLMERTLGRPLEKHERVHHKNGKRDDNRPENLELWKVKAKDPAGVRASDYHCAGCRCGEAT